MVTIALYSHDSPLKINLYNGKSLSPIETRAWTIGEATHARRLIKFTNHEMMSQCLERRICGCESWASPL